MTMLGAVSSAFSDDIAIDLGTANTLVHVRGKGIIIDEPSVVAIRNRDGQREVLAVGATAKMMVGRTPESIETIKPLRDGVIADFIAAEEMLRQFIRRTKSMMGFRRPRILISVPAGATPVERRAVYETALNAGSRRVSLIEEPVAAAIGAGLPIDDTRSIMVVDIGGGTTDIAVLSRGEVVQARSLRVAGNAFDAAISKYVRKKHQLLIGEANAEKIKIGAGTASAKPNGRDAEIHLRGRDIYQGRMKSIVLSPSDVAAALEDPIDDISEFIQRALEDLRAEASSDICEGGIHLTGGSALLHGLDTELERLVGVPFKLSTDPLQSVVQGTARVLEETHTYEHLLIQP